MPPAYVRAALDASLARLETDRVDLLYYHAPDGITPIAETLGAMAELVSAGKVRAIGVSNVTLEQLNEAAQAAPVAALQNEYSLLERGAERDALPRCRELGIAFVPYYPLAGGLLTGKYRRGAPPPDDARWGGGGPLTAETRVSRGVSAAPATFAAIERLEATAREHGQTLLELSIAALASQPGVASVIAGATSPEQVRANAAAGAWELTPDELARLPQC